MKGSLDRRCASYESSVATWLLGCENRGAGTFEYNIDGSYGFVSP